MSDYQQAFFTVPNRIMQLPDLTITFLRFFETIFQFWHHDKPCHLSNGKIKERTGIQSDSTISEAFVYFEKHKQMTRITKNGRRYIVPVLTEIEIDPVDNSKDKDKNSTKNDATLSLQRDPPSRYSETPPLATARHNKNNINNTNINKNFSASNGDAHEISFEDFWEAYPLKKTKAKAEKIWKSKKLGKIGQQILDHIVKAKHLDKQWRDGFIPHPSTYLNGERWNDEISTMSTQGATTLPKNLFNGANANVRIISEEERLQIEKEKQARKLKHVADIKSGQDSYARTGKEAIMKIKSKLRNAAL